jgi:hypothetical protein
MSENIPGQLTVNPAQQRELLGRLSAMTGPGSKIAAAVWSYLQGCVITGDGWTWPVCAGQIADVLGTTSHKVRQAIALLTHERCAIILASEPAPEAGAGFHRHQIAGVAYEPEVPNRCPAGTETVLEMRPDGAGGTETVALLKTLVDVVVNLIGSLEIRQQQPDSRGVPFRYSESAGSTETVAGRPNEVPIRYLNDACAGAEVPNRYLDDAGGTDSVAGKPGEVPNRYSEDAGSTDSVAGNPGEVPKRYAGNGGSDEPPNRCPPPFTGADSVRTRHRRQREWLEAFGVQAPAAMRKILDAGWTDAQVLGWIFEFERRACTGELDGAWKVHQLALRLGEGLEAGDPPAPMLGRARETLGEDPGAYTVEDLAVDLGGIAVDTGPQLFSGKYADYIER